jgi:hypothetical protein
MTLPVAILTNIYSASVYHDSPYCYSQTYIHHLYGVNLYAAVLTITVYCIFRIWILRFSLLPTSQTYIQHLYPMNLPVANLTNIYTILYLSIFMPWLNSFLRASRPCCGLGDFYSSSNWLLEIGWLSRHAPLMSLLRDVRACAGSGGVISRVGRFFKSFFYIFNIRQAEIRCTHL